MKNLILALFLFLGIKSNSQSFVTNNGVEVGLNLGSTTFLGDLGGNKGIGKPFIFDANFNTNRFSAGMFVSIPVHYLLKVRAAYNISHVSGDDAIINSNGGAEIYRKWRNLNFQSKINDYYLGLEFYPIELFTGIPLEEQRLQIYGIAGVGMFHFNPQTMYNGVLTDLQPLHTEGVDYKLTQIMFPTGLGFKYYVTPSFFIGTEVLNRLTNTDYIDDVSTVYIDPSKLTSQAAKDLYYRGDEIGRPLPAINEQRGDSKHKDSYFTITLKLGFNIYESPFHTRNRQLECPRF